jgi:ABC-type amino acid transport system permease subunit
MFWQSKLRQHLVLATLMTVALYVVGNAVTLVHELGHGFTAVALGGYFPFLQIDAEGGRSVYLFPAGSASWREAMVLLAGPVVNFLVAIAALALAVVGVKGRGLRLFVIYVGGVSALLLLNGTGLLPPWWLNYKETGVALNLLNAPLSYQYIIKTVWLLMTMALVACLFRLFFRELATFLPSASYRDRFLMVTSSLGVPFMVLIATLSVVMLTNGHDEGVITIERHTPHIVVLFLTYFLLPLVINRAVPVEGRTQFRIRQWQFAACLAVGAVFAIAQPVVFGNNRTTPAGLFLYERPPEVIVSSCNVSVTLGDNYRARVRLLLRPFPQEHNFLWERIRNVEPKDWELYEQFASENLSTLLGTDRFQMTGHYSDPEVPFFNATWTHGARIIEAEADLSDLPKTKGPDSVSVLTLTDFWKKRAKGYIDFTELKLEGNLQIQRFKVRPEGARSPKLQTSNLLQWENTDYTSSFLTGAFGIR